MAVIIEEFTSKGGSSNLRWLIKEDLVGLARDILENNYFEFNETIYRQRMGTAIGTSFAPAFANIFMSLCRKKMLSQSSLKRAIW